MEFQEGQILHIYNQGNNREKIFFKPKNYYFFMQKVEKHLIPYVDILAYCLMPNHFHFLVCCKAQACKESNILRPWSKEGRQYQQALSKGIALMLRAYTRAINIQENRSGSLFRKNTKMKEGLDEYSSFDNDDHYIQTCFDYIHENPVEAGLAHEKSAWKHSSYFELFNGTKKTYCNAKLVQEFGLVSYV